MKLRKVIITVLTAVSLSAGTMSFALSDISGHWAKEYIDVISKYGIMQGYPSGSFNPNGYVTRAELAKIMSLDKWGSTFDYGTEEVFPYYDIAYATQADRHWASQYIAIAGRSGYMKGYPDGTFRPDNYVTRAELASVIAKDESIPINPTISYSDVNPGDWFYSNVLRTGYTRAMGGYPDGTFKPNNYITRGEMAKVMSIYHHNFYIASPEEAARPYEWNPGVKEIFEQIMLERGYVNSVSEITYVEYEIYTGRGYYSVYDKNGYYIVTVDCKTGWFHG